MRAWCELGASGVMQRRRSDFCLYNESSSELGAFVFVQIFADLGTFSQAGFGSSFGALEFPYERERERESVPV